MCPACAVVLELRPKSRRNLEKAVGTAFHAGASQKALADMSEPAGLRRSLSHAVVVPLCNYGMDMWPK